MKQHLSEEQLQGYVTGQMRKLAAAQVEMHLAECAECRQMLGLQQELNQLLEELETPPISADFDARLQKKLVEPKRERGWVSRWGWLAAAAALVVALWLGWQKAPQGDPLPIERVEETLADLEALSVLEGEESEAL
jgi:anti-sigma factor RsiW